MPTAAEKKAAAEAKATEDAQDTAQVDAETDPEEASEHPGRTPNTAAFRVTGADGEVRDHVVLGEARADLKERGGTMDRLL